MAESSSLFAPSVTAWCPASVPPAAVTLLSPNAVSGPPVAAVGGCGISPWVDRDYGAHPPGRQGSASRPAFRPPFQLPLVRLVQTGAPHWRASLTDIPWASRTSSPFSRRFVAICELSKARRHCHHATSRARNYRGVFSFRVIRRGQPSTRAQPQSG